MVHFEDAEPRGERAAISVSVETCAEHHQLTNSAFDGRSQRIFGETRSHGDEDAHPAAGGMLFGFSRDGGAVFTEDAERQRIGEDASAFQHLMGGAMKGGGARCAAGLSGLHSLRVYDGRESGCGGDAPIITRMDSSRGRAEWLSEGGGGEGLYLRLHAVNVFVRDQDQSLRFYVDQLGFQVAFDAKLQSGDRWIAVAPPDGGAVLALLAPQPDAWEYRLIGRSTGIVFVTENVIAKYSEWRKRGVRFQFAPRLRRVTLGRRMAGGSATEPEEQAGLWGGVFTQFKDPDGNSFALVGFDEVTREIEAQRRALAQKAEAERRAVQELAIAKQVQARLFPQTLPPMKTLEYAGTCIQARQVGGDYFDFLDLGRDCFGLVVGDIAGKGIAAALLMANLQANLRIHCATGLEEPRRLLQSVNRVFHKNTNENAFATLFFAEYDDAERRLRYANCGHLPPLLVRDDGSVERLEATGTVLGLFGEWDCTIEERKLHPGDTLLIYTDGVTEALNGGGEEFGERRLIAALRRHRRLPAQGIISAIADEVCQFSGEEQHDDITLTVAKCR